MKVIRWEIKKLEFSGLQTTPFKQHEGLTWSFQSRKETLVISKEPTFCKIEIDGINIKQSIGNQLFSHPTIELRRYRYSSKKSNTESQ